MDADGLESLLKRFSKEQSISSLKDYSIVISTPSLIDKRYIGTLSETFFEKFKVKNLAIYEEPQVDLISFGLISGLLMHSSHTQSYSVCISDGEIVRRTQFKGGLTGRDLSSLIQENFCLEEKLADQLKVY